MAAEPTVRKQKDERIKALAIVCGVTALSCGAIALIPVFGKAFIPPGFVASAVALGLAAWGRSRAAAAVGGLGFALACFAAYLQAQQYGHDLSWHWSFG